MSLGPWQLAIIAILILVLFGRGKISEMMGDFGKGIKSFKKGMNEEEQADAKPAGQIEAPAQEAKSASESQTKDQAAAPTDKS